MISNAKTSTFLLLFLLASCGKENSSTVKSIASEQVTEVDELDEYTCILPATMGDFVSIHQRYCKGSTADMMDLGRYYLALQSNQYNGRIQKEVITLASWLKIKTLSANDLACAESNFCMKNTE